LPSRIGFDQRLADLSGRNTLRGKHLGVTGFIDPMRER